MVKVVFVCLGNICRSPAAEGVFIDLVKKEGLQDQIYIDSAGTSGYHVGALADSRMREAASKRGFDLPSRSRRFEQSDLSEFDYIVPMDHSNTDDIKSLDVGGKFAHKVRPICSFCSFTNVDYVPDPYYGGEAGFENVLDIVTDGCIGLLKEIKGKI